MSKTLLKQARKKNAVEAAILNRLLDRDSTLNRRAPLRKHAPLSGKVFASQERVSGFPEKGLTCGEVR